jgi:TonB family protein
LALILASLSLTGCASSKNNEVVKYSSRCEITSINSEENSKQPTHERLLSTTPPKYPVKAIKKRIEGYVKLEFDISERGEPININVIESSPAKVFDQAAINSFKNWRYEAIASTCNKVQLDFEFG